jgi:hypothetical protein
MIFFRAGERRADSLGQLDMSRHALFELRE